MTTPVNPGLPTNLGMNSYQAWGQQNNSLLASPGAFTASGRSTYGQKARGSDQVFMGTVRSKQGIDPETKQPTFGQRSTYMSMDQARFLPREWDDATMRDFINKGIVNKIPGFDHNMGLPEIMSAWDDMLQSSVAFSTGEKPLSPWDIMNSYANNEGKFGTKKVGDWIVDLATGERLKYAGPTSKTVKSERINLSSAADVRVIALQALREALGRAPTDQEVAQFRSSINAMEQATPEVTTTVQQLSPNLATGQVEVTSEKSTTTGGVAEAAKAMAIQEAAQETPEFAKYQAGTTYFNALMQMIGGGF